MKKYLLISIYLLYLVFSCKKDGIDLHKYAGLPDATQTGENTMGCLINGKTWVAQKEGFTIGWPTFTEKVDCFYGEIKKNISDIDKFSFDLHTYRFVGKVNGGYSTQQSFLIKIKPLINEGKYSINKDNFKIEYIDGSFSGSNKIYISENIDDLNFEITKLDTVNNIIAGLFDLKLIEIDNINDTIRITNGRFDANYWPK